MPTFYENNPALREAFESLPIYIKNRILESGVEIITLQDLERAAANARLVPTAQN